MNFHIWPSKDNFTFDYYSNTSNSTNDGDYNETMGDGGAGFLERNDLIVMVITSVLLGIMILITIIGR